MGESEDGQGCEGAALGNRRVGWDGRREQWARASGLRVALRHGRVLAPLCLHGHVP